MGTKAIILSGGQPAHTDVRRYLPSDSLVIAADSGYGDAAPLGLRVDLLVGDLDSIAADDLAHAHATGVDIERHPGDKDATDLDLAIEAARRRGAHRITVVSGGGGRLDHLFAGITLLGAPRYGDLELRAWIGSAFISVLHGPARAHLAGERGQLVTLVPVGGPAHGIETSGLRFPLRGETLWPGDSRGVSNEMIDEHADVTLAEGILLVIEPEALRHQEEQP